MKVIHIPFSGRNPYQKLLSNSLRNRGIDVQGAQVNHVKNISFLNLSLFSLLFNHWKSDIIHLHWQSTFINVDGSRLKTTAKSLLFIFQLWIVKLLGIKLVWTVHNLNSHEDKFKDLEDRFTAKLAQLSNGIIVHCQSAKKEILSRMGTTIKDRIRVIPHGHFMNYYPNTIDRNAALKKLGLHNDGFKFLFLGELRFYKGIFELIDVFKAMGLKNSQLIIAGRPHNKQIHDEIQRIVADVENIITHYTFVPEQELQDYINASDVMVFPYRNIFTSGGIFLALSYGKPIVAPALGCIADALGETPNFIYEVTKGDGLAGALTKAIESKDSLYSIGQHNRKLADKYGWQNIADKTIELYQKCIK